MAGGTLKPLEIVGGNIAYSLRPADYVLSRALGAGVAESITVPALGRHVLIERSSGTDIFVDYTTTAVVPGDVTNGTAPEMNPTMRFISGVTTISVICAAATIVTASFWTD